jgi:hypothetical protein
MTSRSTAVLAMAFAGLAMAGAQAQVRTEPPSSVFVWEALGATPSIQLRKVGSGAAASGIAHAASGKAQAPSGPAAPSVSANDAPAATPQLRRPGTAPASVVAPQGAR